MGGYDRSRVSVPGFGGVFFWACDLAHADTFLYSYSRAAAMDIHTQRL